VARGAYVSLRCCFSNGYMVSGYVCAGCGEWNETTVDESAGSRQRYVEDCQVCCKPNVLRVSWDTGAGDFAIDAELE
jgi:hypothetical protein